MIESCWLEGAPFSYTQQYSGGQTALQCSGGSLQIAGATTIQGGDGTPYIAAGNGIYRTGTSLRILGGTVRSGSLGPPNPVGGGDAIYDAQVGPLRISPRVILYASNPQSYYVTAGHFQVMPQLTGTGASPGGTLSATAETEVGDLVVLVVGLPGPEAVLPIISDPFWLHPADHVFTAIGTQQLTAPISDTAAVPNLPGYLGTHLVWQAVCYGPVTGFQATNPVVTLVH